MRDLGSIQAAGARDLGALDVSSANQTEPKQGIWKTIGSALISSEKNLGESISAALPFFNGSQNVEQGNMGLLDQENKVLKQIVENRRLGKDTSSLEKVLKDSLNGVVTAEEVNPSITKTNKQIFGEAAGVGLDILTAGAFSGVAKSGKILSAASRAAAPLGKNFADEVTTIAPTLGRKLSDIGTKYLKTATLFASIGYGYDVSTGLQEGESTSDAMKPGLGTVLGAVLPVVPAVYKAGKASVKETAPTILNSLIKPLLKDFSYGKNPGRTVAEEGITANSLDELGSKIGSRRQEIGAEIGSIATQLDSKLQMATTRGSRIIQPLGLAGALKPIDDAMVIAAKTNNKSLLARLQEVKDALMYSLHLGYEEGAPVIVRGGARELSKSSFEDAASMKTMVGDMTRWTGNESDDKAINGALKAVYGQIKDVFNSTAEKIDPALAARLRQLNEKYADLTSAEIAAKYRDKISSRQNLISLPQGITGIGGAIAVAILSGGAAIPTLLAGVSALALEKALGSTAVKTRIAAWLASESPSVLDALFAKNPQIAKVLYKVFVEETNVDKKIADYVKNVQPGLSMKNIVPDANAKGNGLYSAEKVDMEAIKKMGNKEIPAQRADTSGPFEGEKYFHTSKGGSITEFKDTGKPTYFSKDPAFKDKYQGDKGTNTEVSLDLKKTATLDDAMLTKLLKDSYFANQARYPNVKAVVDDFNMSDVDVRDYVFEKLKAQGYDSAVIKKDWDGAFDFMESTVVFDPKRIKTTSSPSIPKELEALAKEARKYKSAEDFANNLLYHGTSESRATKILSGEGLVGSRGRVGSYKGKGIKYVSMTPDANAALGYASGRGEQASIVAIPRPSRILDLGDIRTSAVKTPEAVAFRKAFGTNEIDWGGKEVQTYLKSKDADAIQFMAPDGHIEIRVFGDIKNSLRLPKEFITTNPKTGYWEINQKALTDFFNSVKP